MRTADDAQGSSRSLSLAGRLESGKGWVNRLGQRRVVEAEDFVVIAAG
jgi:hypothetical protein